MLSNLHTHTTFCDGKNTAEEVVIAALEKGFSSIGFSGHGHTFFDLRYCIKDLDGYKSEINRLKEKYKKDIQIYLGTEEEMLDYVKREEYDYIIGSSHYIKRDSEYLSLDTGVEPFKACLQAFDNNPLALAENYYQNFCSYILKRKPDIVGHFDLITKFDEFDECGFFLGNKEYMKISEKYLNEAVKSECIFEINTGAIANGYRKTQYPEENLLHILKKNNSKIILSADSHRVDTLDFKFDDMKEKLKDIGFKYIYVLYNGEFVRESI